jgi:hypothetical protein
VIKNYNKIYNYFLNKTNNEIKLKKSTDKKNGEYQIRRKIRGKES